MRKSQLVAKVSEMTGLPKVDVIMALEKSFQIIKESLRDDEPVFIRGFGTFKLKKRKAKKARIIKRNIEILVPEHNIPFFKPSPEFSKMVYQIDKEDDSLDK